MPMSLAFSSGVTLPTALAALVERGLMFGQPHGHHAKTSQRAIHILLGGSDGMNRGQKSFYDSEVVTDDLGQEVKKLVVQEALLTTLKKLSILFMVHIHHKHGGIHRRGRNDDPLDSLFK